MRNLCVSAWVLAIVLLTSAGIVQADDLYKVSLADGVLAENERIMSFVLRVKHGSIRVVSKIPSMWELSISNYLSKDPPWHTTLDGASSVVTGALTKDEMNGLVLIGRESRRPEEALEVDLVIHTYASGTEKEAEKHLSRDQVILEIIEKTSGGN
jgi:hypothetical protein